MIEARGLSCRCVWLRYNHYSTKFLLALCRLLGLTEYEYFGELRVGYHNFHRSRIISVLFILLTYIDILFISLLKVKLPALFSNRTIICDRWIPDIMVDLETDTGVEFRVGRLLTKAFLGIMPKRTRCFVVQRDREAILEGRPENAHDRNFPRRVELYERQANDLHLNIVDNNGTIDDAVASVKDSLDSGE